MITKKKRTQYRLRRGTRIICVGTLDQCWMVLKNTVSVHASIEAIELTGYVIEPKDKGK